MKSKKSLILRNTYVKDINHEVLTPGTVLIFKEIFEDVRIEGKLNIPNDKIICEGEDGRRFALSIRDYLKMQCTGKEPLYKTNRNNIDLVILPERITIVHSSDRQDKNYNLIYPVEAYKGYKRYKAGDISIEDVYNTRLENTNSFKPLQDYIIEVSYV